MLLNFRLRSLFREALGVALNYQNFNIGNEAEGGQIGGQIGENENTTHGEHVFTENEGQMGEKSGASNEVICKRIVARRNKLEINILC